MVDEKDIRKTADEINYRLRIAKIKPENIENIDNSIITSWKTATIAPKLYCHFLNLIRIYKKSGF